MTSDAPPEPLDQTGSDSALIDAVGCGIWLYDGEDIVFVNDALTRLTGYSREQLLSPQFFQRLIHPDDGEMIVARGQARVRGEEVPPEYEVSVIAGDGRRVWLHIYARAVQYEGRACSLVSALDISERKEAERALQFLAGISTEIGASLDYSETLGRIARLCVPYLGDYAVVDIREATGQLHRIAGAHRDPARESLMMSNSPDARKFGAGHPIYEVATTGHSQVLSGDIPSRVAADARHHEMLSELNPHTYVIVPLTGAGGAILGAISFASERELPPWHLRLIQRTGEEVGRRAAQAIEHARLYERAQTAAAEAEYHLNAIARSEQRLRLAQSAARMGTWEWTVGSSTVDWSEEMERVYGLEPGSFAGTFDAYLECIYPDDRAAVLASVEQLQTHGSNDVEHRVQLADGTIRWLAGRGQLFPGAEGQPARAIGVGIDITERKAVEEELRRANAAKDELLGLVSHELRTPLTHILGNASALRRHDSQISPGDRLTALQDISNAAERLQRLIENMLVLSHVEAQADVNTEPVLLQRLIPGVVEAYIRRRTVDFVVQGLDESLPPVLAQPTYVEQVLENLLSNAEKYAKGDAPVEVIARAADDGVVVGVLDRGRGIPAGEIETIFSPFFRSNATAASSSGAGLGLAVCRRLAEVQGGRMWAEQREGGGSAFWFLLPAADG